MGRCEDAGEDSSDEIHPILAAREREKKKGTAENDAGKVICQIVATLKSATWALLGSALNPGFEALFFLHLFFFFLLLLYSNQIWDMRGLTLTKLVTWSETNVI